MNSAPSDGLKDKFMMTFKLQTRANEESTAPGLPPQNENPIEASAEQSTSTIQNHPTESLIDETINSYTIPRWLNESASPHTELTLETLNGRPAYRNYQLNGNSSQRGYNNSQLPSGFLLNSENSRSAYESGDLLRFTTLASHITSLIKDCRYREHSLQEKINDLPLWKVTAENIANAELCSVCMENYTLDEMITKLPCCHLFHRDCISPWLKKHQTCPICRKVAIFVSGRSKRLYKFQPYNRQQIPARLNYIRDAYFQHHNASDCRQCNCYLSNFS